MGAGWPPADFDHWPPTRIVAIAVNIILVALLIIGCVLPRRFWKQAVSNNSFVITESPFRRWGWWIVGHDSISISGDQLIITQDRCCCFCPSRPGDIEIHKLKVISIDATKRPITFLETLWAFLMGGVTGLWLHFWPCLWWTCDWGPNDGEAVRGGIWFISWALVFIILIFRSRTMALKIRYTQEETNTPKEIYVAIANGNAYKYSCVPVMQSLVEIRHFVGKKIFNESSDSEREVLTPFQKYDGSSSGKTNRTSSSNSIIPHRPN